MSEYCHRKAVRFKIDEELAYRLLKVDDRWDIEDLLKAPFEIAPTKEFFIAFMSGTTKVTSSRAVPVSLSSAMKTAR